MKKQILTLLCALIISTTIRADETQTLLSPKEHEELARYKAKDELDEANKQINSVWNATTKEIRATLLPEQKQWLKKRENDCTQKATTEQANNSIVQDTIKLHCMAAMTDPRTEELKQKIASMTDAPQTTSSATAPTTPVSDSLTQASIPKVEKQVLQKGVFLYSDCKEKTEEDCLCEADINYPIISGLGNETAQAELNQAFKTEAENNGKCEGKPINTSKKEIRDYSFHDYEVTFISPDVLAIDLVDSNEGGAHPMNWDEGFIIDVATGKKLSAKDVFGKNIEQVNQIIYEKLNTIEYQGEIEECKYIEGDVCNNCSLFLSKEGVKIVFTRYAVADGAEGNPEVLIPNKYITYPAIAHYFK